MQPTTSVENDTTIAIIIVIAIVKIIDCRLHQMHLPVWGDATAFWWRFAMVGGFNAFDTAVNESLQRSGGWASWYPANRSQFNLPWNRAGLQLRMCVQERQQDIHPAMERKLVRTKKLLGFEGKFFGTVTKNVFFLKNVVHGVAMNIIWSGDECRSSILRCRLALWPQIFKIVLYQPWNVNNGMNGKWTQNQQICKIHEIQMKAWWKQMIGNETGMKETWNKWKSNFTVGKHLMF